jgi:hypothetical protein
MKGILITFFFYCFVRFGSRIILFQIHDDSFNNILYIFLSCFLYSVWGMILYILNKKILHIEIWQFILSMIISSIFIVLSFIFLLDLLIDSFPIQWEPTFSGYFRFFILLILDDPMDIYEHRFINSIIFIIMPVISFFILHIFKLKIKRIRENKDKKNEQN